MDHDDIRYLEENNAHPEDCIKYYLRFEDEKEKKKPSSKWLIIA
jgi:hypothetical protein